MRIVWLCIPHTTIDIRYDSSDIATFFAGLFISLPICLWLCASCLIVGFWYLASRQLLPYPSRRLDILSVRLAREMIPRTRIVCIVLAAISIFAIIGTFLTVFEVTATIGIILVVIPIFVNVTSLLVVSILIACLSSKDYSKNTLRKKRKVPFSPTLFRILLFHVAPFCVFSWHCSHCLS